MSISIYQTDLTQQVQQGIISAATAAELWKNLSNDDANRWRLGWVHLAYGLGGFLILGSITWFTSIVWQEQNLGLFLLASLYTLVFGYAGVTAWKPNSWKIPQIVGGIFTFISVCTVPVAIFGLQRYYEYFPQDYPGLYQALGLLLASWIGLSVVPWAPITAPMFFALYFISEVDAAPMIFGVPFDKITALEFDYVSVAFGLGIILASVSVDKPANQDFSIWGYLFGLLAFWGAMTDLYFGPYYRNGYYQILYVAVNLLLSTLSVHFQRIIFLIFGGAGVSIALVNFLITEATVAESSWFYIVFGAGLIGSAYQVQNKYPDATYPFWGYLSGVSVFWGGWTTLMFWPVYTNIYFRIAYFVVNVGLLAGSVETKQRVFLFYGSVGTMWFIVWLSEVYLVNSWWLPVILTVIGIGFIVLAVEYSGSKKAVVSASASASVPEDVSAQKAMMLNEDVMETGIATSGSAVQMDSSKLYAYATYLAQSQSRHA